MNLKKIMPSPLGALIFLLILLTFSYLTSTDENSQELTVDSALTKIRSKNFKEVHFKNSQVDLLDSNDSTFVVAADSEPMRETVLKAVFDFNAANESAPMKISQDAVSRSSVRVLLVSYFPFIIIFVLSIFIAFFLGKKSNKNKG